MTWHLCLLGNEPASPQCPFQAEPSAPHHPSPHPIFPRACLIAPSITDRSSRQRARTCLLSRFIPRVWSACRILSDTPPVLFLVKLVGMTTTHVRLHVARYSTWGHRSEGTAQAGMSSEHNYATHSGSGIHTPSAQSCINALTFSLRFRLTPPTARLRMVAINLRLKEADGRGARSKVCLIKPSPRR